jgi:cytoskeleton protein RodZ
MTDKNINDISDNIDESLDDADNLGIQFSRARRAKKISLEQAAEATKIKPSFIKAIERGDFDLLPGGIYTKGYVRTYSDYLGLATPKIINDLESLETGGIAGTMMPYAPQRSERSNMTPANGLMVVCLLGIFGIVYLWNDRAEKNEHMPDPSIIANPVPMNVAPVDASPVEIPATPIPANVVTPVPDNQPAPAPVVTAIPTPATTEPDPLANIQQQLSEASAATKQALENATAPTPSVAPPSATPAPAVNTEDEATDEIAPKPNVAEQATAPAPKNEPEENIKKKYKSGNFVTLVAKKATKISLYNKTGERIFEQELAAGENFVLPQREDIKIKADNSGSLDLKIDDSEVGNLGTISSDANGMLSVQTIHNALSE